MLLSTQLDYHQQNANGITRAVAGRRVFTTEQKRVGLGPEEMLPGDTIVILKGCGVPLILRSIGDHMVLVGEAYVSGMMRGEIMSAVGNGQYTPRMITLK
jgi:hypothetical protein